MIDFTLPVETTEDPPRPVRVLFDKDGEVCALEIFGELYKRIGIRACRPGLDSIPLRNVPAKPVLIEGWVNFVMASTTYEGGTAWIVRNGAVWETKEAAHIEAGKMPDVTGTAFIRAMSDGSPVPASPEQFDQMREMATLIQDRDHWRSKAESLQATIDNLSKLLSHTIVKRAKECDERDALQAEVKRLKAELLHRDKWTNDARAEVLRVMPVVDAAVAWVLPELRGSYTGDTQRLIEAVRAYQGQQSAEPVKNCTSCKYGPYRKCSDIRCGAGNGSYRKWESRHE